MTNLTVVPSGAISKPQDEIQTILSNSSTFQTATGAANATAALAYIHLSPTTWNAVTEQTWRGHRPFAVIVADGGGVKYELAADDTWVKSGVYRFYFEEDEDTAQPTPDDSSFTFTNLVGDVIQDMLDYTATTSVLQLEDIELTIARSDPREDNSRGPYWQAAGTISWIQ